ncbi:hypothetical protein H2204_010448 [Knufia peltigerae]|uniref:Uncharacterized protein n=1 Tax=Knufia peltigerae TaxID=1002370 RepID=A0AA38XW43_9EURO|nr:hypothetical protein H2204_010448 [Knufia peltigerae]
MSTRGILTFGHWYQKTTVTGRPVLTVSISLGWWMRVSFPQIIADGFVPSGCPTRFVKLPRMEYLQRGMSVQATDAAGCKNTRHMTIVLAARE